MRLFEGLEFHRVPAFTATEFGYIYTGDERSLCILVTTMNEVSLAAYVSDWRFLQHLFLR